MEYLIMLLPFSCLQNPDWTIKKDFIGQKRGLCLAYKFTKFKLTRITIHYNLHHSILLAPYTVPHVFLHLAQYKGQAIRSQYLRRRLYLTKRERFPGQNTN